MKIVLLAALCAAIAAPAAFAKSQTTLNGTVGPGFTITLTDGSKTVKTLKPGTYLFKINDRSNIHNFHLTGPGVDKKTSVKRVAHYTWKLKLKKGTYRYVCDPHRTIMKGSFKVT